MCRSSRRCASRPGYDRDVDKPELCDWIRSGAESCPHVAGCHELVAAYRAGYDQALLDFIAIGKEHRGELVVQAKINSIFEALRAKRRAL